jgi:putative ABC transport system permease protein
MDWLRSDLKFALRSLTRRPGATALAVFTLAVGLGVNTVAWSAMNALVYRSANVPNADRIGWLAVGTAQDQLRGASIPMFEAITRNQRTLAMVAAEVRQPFAWDSDGRTDQVWASVVTPHFFDLVPAPTIAGRALTASDSANLTSAVPVVVSERFWQRRLGGAADVFARPVALNGRSVAIVGIIKDGYQAPVGVFEPDLWVPLAARRQLGLPASLDEPGRETLSILAQPRPGITADAIALDIAAIAHATEPLPDRTSYRVTYTRVIDGHPEVRQIARGARLGLLAVGVVLLIACFNVASLLVARAAERRRDLAIRSSLGASKWRLVREMLAESLMLAAIAGVLSLVLASFSASLLGAFSLPAPIPQRLHFKVDWMLVSVAAALSLVAAIVPSLVPIWQILRADLSGWVRAAAPGAVGIGTARARRTFLILQVAGSTVFLVAALFFVSRYVDAATVDLGFEKERLAVLEINPSQYGYTAQRSRDLMDALRDRARALPGVVEASVADRIPFFVGHGRRGPVSPTGGDCRQLKCPDAETASIDSAHLEAMDIPLIAGRNLTATDREAVLVDRTAAEQFWPGASAVGQWLREPDDVAPRRVVGVVENITHQLQNTQTRRPHIYEPIGLAQYGAPLTLVMRTAGQPEAVLPLVSDLLHDLDPRLPPQSLKTMNERLALPLWPQKTSAGFFGVCGAISVLLATVGLFGVIHYVANQRMREFGVRAAIGASPRDLTKLVVGESVRMIAPGIVAGATMALLLGGTMRWIAFGAAAVPAIAFVAAISVQFIVAIAASLGPALRAGRVNPVSILRAD